MRVVVIPVFYLVLDSPAGEKGAFEAHKSRVLHIVQLPLRFLPAF
jgi:hypothetical protein